jgi:outer membrane usher protein
VTTKFQLYFNTSHRGVSYNLYASQSLADQRTAGDRQFGISVSLPLGTAKRRSMLSMDARKSGDQWSERATLSGVFNENRYSYNASVADQGQGQRTAAVSLAHQGPFASMSGGYTQGNDYNNLSVNASGGFLVHSEGVAFGPYLGETMGLVHVANTPGVSVAHTTAVQTNAKGYALIPNLRPYRINQVELRTDHLGPEVMLENGTAQLVPTRGAVVRADFTARRMEPVVINARGPDGKPLPFGAQVLNQRGDMLGVVGQAGQIMLASLVEAQTLHVQWAQSLCQLHLDPESMSTRGGYRLQELTCDRNPPATANLPQGELNDDA